ncbi:hypothetical protein IEN85_15885 [Pelagicoccus sp. NFK12]|uniref:Uncharacterized protein n=1 Tax=Pelagicoccus enzymogenes TaxID=2773457 RepID=A0A927FBZ1_9BACT|nr:hypothetical protein [Pelagicoccus enzymogenes]MBD5780981.1 hypothetical protein [Pelagicoccus enzymogenes]
MPEQSLSLFAEIFVFSCVGLSILFGVLNTRVTSLKVSVLNRWARWLGVAFGAAYLVYDAGWLNRPFWVIGAIFFLGWLLIETVYTWLAISALSKSSISLFPRFSENTTGEEWPAQKKLIEIKDWLKSKGFTRSKALLADVGHGLNIRSTVFQSEDQKTRFQILFVPQHNGDIGFCFSFSSETQSGDRFVTDNLYMPYGGYYPDNWAVARKPWTRDAAKLYKLHLSRIAKLELAAFEFDPLDDLNQQQRELEQINLKQGFLFAPQYQEEHGRITWEGRYRVWKEVWLLNYFGISMV